MHKIQVPSPEKKKGPAQPPKGFKQPNNGITCTCAANGPESGCRASHHVRRAERLEEFVDCTGKQIEHGSVLRYTNPNHPNRFQPLHTATWNEKKKRMFLFEHDKNGKPTILRGARSSGKWNPRRWKVIGVVINGAITLTA